MPIPKPYFYYPNLIGYTRVISAILSFNLADKYPITAIAFYTFSFLLDALDGLAARTFNQATQFGAVLDMVTDRFATACLCFNIAAVYPSSRFILQCLTALDIVSHWFHMYDSLSSGNKSHKLIDETKNRFIKLYYTSRTCLTIMCLGNELFYIAWLLSYYHPKLALYILAFNFPIFALKTAMNVVQLCSSVQSIVLRDAAAKEE